MTETGAEIFAILLMVALIICIVTLIIVFSCMIYDEFSDRRKPREIICDDLAIIASLHLLVMKEAMRQKQSINKNKSE